ncbi:MAG: hypothetical protein IKT07_11565 [Oscillospiraceae bacterium]|nr:hypothetical protein [Oscillospiraceae bacterium]
MLKEEMFDNLWLCCDVIPMGQDYTLAVYGGECPHVGSVVMSVARPSLTGDGISATSSVLNGIGHKDEAVARLFAEAVAKAKNCTTVCSCGIHVDSISTLQLRQVQEAGTRLLERILAEICR